MYNDFNERHVTLEVVLCELPKWAIWILQYSHMIWRIAAMSPMQEVRAPPMLRSVWKR